jgi:hypothetical protein
LPRKIKTIFSRLLEKPDKKQSSLLFIPTLRRSRNFYLYHLPSPLFYAQGSNFALY